MFVNNDNYSWRLKPLANTSDNVKYFKFLDDICKGSVSHKKFKKINIFMILQMILFKISYYFKNIYIWKKIGTDKIQGQGNGHSSRNAHLGTV